MTKPRLYDKGFIDFKTDIDIGGKVVIVTEFDHSPKFKSFLLADVTLANGETRMLSLNKSSYRLIAEKYGEDTLDWIGKTIVYKGEQQLGAMKGRVWGAE